jgi:hypothetical protein
MRILPLNIHILALNIFRLFLALKFNTLSDVISNQKKSGGWELQTQHNSPSSDPHMQTEASNPALRFVPWRTPNDESGLFPI